MEEETKVTETPKVSVDESLIDNGRTAIEDKVISDSNTFEVPKQESTDSKPKDESSEPKPESEGTEVERIKKAVQKRIDKVVAKQKSAEERLVEAEAELARLKSTPTQEVKKDDTPPTIEQVEAYILKMAEEGNKKEEIAATRYLIRLEKEAAIKEVEDRQNKIRQESESRSTRENQALLDLAKDYIVYDDKGKPDMKSDLTLANQKGKLFEIAMGLYNDPELHAQYYNDPDRVHGLRRAVADAYREIHQQNLIKTPKADVVEKRVTKQLADPDAVEVDETPTSSTLLSDTDKVRDEIKSRQSRMRIPRKAA